MTPVFSNQCLTAVMDFFFFLARAITKLPSVVFFFSLFFPLPFSPSCCLCSVLPLIGGDEGSCNIDGDGGGNVGSLSLLERVWVESLKGLLDRHLGTPHLSKTIAKSVNSLYKNARNHKFIGL